MRFDRCIAEADKVENWCRFTVLLRQIGESGTLDYLVHSFDKTVNPESVPGGFKRAFYRQWIETALRRSSAAAGSLAVSSASNRIRR